MMETRASAMRSTVSAREKTMSVGGGDTDDDGVSEEPDSPPSAFFLFMDDFRKDYEEKHPADAKQVYEIGMAGDEAWKSMSDDAKAHYVSKVEELKEEYMSNRNAYLGVADGLKRKKNEQRRQRAKKAKKDMDTTSDP